MLLLAILFEHNVRYNALVLRVTLKSIMPKFSSIMYLTNNISFTVLQKLYLDKVTIYTNDNTMN